MHPKYKNKSIIGVGVGLSLFVVGWLLFLFDAKEKAALGGLALGSILVGLPIYVWGCICLARAKGYSTAIVLTVVLGGLFPLVLLAVLPDKNKHYHRGY